MSNGIWNVFQPYAKHNLSRNLHAENRCLSERLRKTTFYFFSSSFFHLQTKMEIYFKNSFFFYIKSKFPPCWANKTMMSPTDVLEVLYLLEEKEVNHGTPVWVGCNQLSGKWSSDIALMGFCWSLAAHCWARICLWTEFITEHCDWSPDWFGSIPLLALTSSAFLVFSTHFIKLTIFISPSCARDKYNQVVTCR